MWILQGSADEQPVTFRLSQGAVKTLGRAPGADLIVDAALVSRVHCRLEAGDETVQVVDLSSTNGTFVNDRRIDKGVLTAGDRLRVGRVELQVARHTSDEAGSPTPD
jgi:pSer/pThr/pTyr-binding forkhead associated (FHA) protein